ncbi:MAG: hypothetical protein ACD_21C00250G0019 [uncultured bacterium]|nr:MAG: hypothetical protein ACD_21C00250G0019 [uncultured bacterium]
MPQKIPTITHIITDLAPGGAETFLLRLVSSLKDFQHHVVSLAPIEDTNFTQLFFEKAASVTSLDISSKNIHEIYKLFSLSSLLKQQAPHLVQTWMYHANVIGGIAAKINKLPVIWNIRNSSLSKETPESLKLNTFTNYVVKTGAVLSKYIPETIVSCSHYAALLHQKWGYRKDNFIVIPNGIDIELFSPKPQIKTQLRKELGIGDLEIVIGFVGRLHPQKDIPNFLKAARLFLEHEPNAQFLLCGDGLTKENPLVNKWIENENLNNHCHLLDKISDTHNIYNVLDIYCSPSAYGEAFPNVIAEAMSCGIPCVGTDVGDTRLILGDQGITVPPKDPQALAQAWKHLLSQQIQPSLVRQRIIDNFSLPASSNLYRQLYLGQITKTAKT